MIWAEYMVTSTSGQFMKQSFYKIIHLNQRAECSEGWRNAIFFYKKSRSRGIKSNFGFYVKHSDKNTFSMLSNYVIICPAIIVHYTHMKILIKFYY